MKNAIALLVIPISVMANTAIVSHDIEQTEKIIVASDINIYDNTGYNNIYFKKYGSIWSYGIQIVNLRLYGDQVQNYENDTYVNLSRKFTYQNFVLEVGAQAGYNFSSDSTKKLHATSFVDLNYSIVDDLSIHFGGYCVNDELATKHQPYNFQTGIKYKVDKFIITGDYYSGSNNLSGAIVNVYYQWFDNFRPYIGIIVPEKNSGNEFVGTFGFAFKLNI